MILRTFETDDIDAVAQIWYDSWLGTGLAGPSDPTVADYRQRLRTEGAAWHIAVAGRVDRVEGFVAIDRAERWLRQLFVLPAAQRCGIGSALLDAAKSDMPGGFWLRTDSDNQAARQFYERSGLRFEGEAPHPRFGQMIARYSFR